MSFKVGSIFSGKDSALNLYRYYKLESEVIKTADDDEIKDIGVYYEKSGDFISDLRLLAVNNNRLLIRLSDGYFELERINPEYNSIGELGSDGLTDNQVYTFMDGDITINHYTQALLMVDGTFTSKVAAIIKGDRLLVPLRFISEYFGAKVDWIADEQKVIIVYGDAQIEVKINSKEAKINDKAITLGMLPSIHNDRTYVDFGFIYEAFGIRTGYLPATYKAIANVSAQIKTDIENVKYMGQVGRYALFYSPYIILVFGRYFNQ